MPMEIERKFLVSDLPNNMSIIDVTLIEQAYINEAPETRVRKSFNSGQSMYSLTIKIPEGGYRMEVDVPINSEHYKQLSDYSTNKIIKNRLKYLIDLKFNLYAYLDMYMGDLYGLKTIEVEFKNEAQASSFTPPAWFGEEVTHDDRYKNVNLNKKLWEVPEEPTEPETPTDPGDGGVAGE